MDPKQTVQAFVHAINSQEWARFDSLVATQFCATQHCGWRPARPKAAPIL